MQKINPPLVWQILNHYLNSEKWVENQSPETLDECQHIMQALRLSKVKRTPILDIRDSAMMFLLWLLGSLKRPIRNSLGEELDVIMEAIADEIFKHTGKRETVNYYMKK